MLLFLYMNIIWEGETYIQIVTKSILKDQIVVSIDPFLNGKGKLGGKSDVILLTSLPKGKEVSFPTGPINEDGFLISNPGEYEIKEVYIKGISSEQNNVIYVIESEDITVCHLGHIQQKELNSEQLEKIGEIDILIIPIGNEKLLDKRVITSLINQIEPKIVVPIGYKLNSSTSESPELKSFLKMVGQTGIAGQDKLSIKKKDLFNNEESKVIILNPKKH